MSARLSVPDFDARIFLPQDGHQTRAEALLRAALALVQQHSPIRYQYLKRDFARILIGATRNRGECHEQIALCVLGYEFLTDEATTAQAVASTLVHEGTHARLARAGFLYEASSRARHERLCLMGQALVGRRFPEPTDYEVAERRLREWSPEDWSDEAIRRRGIIGLQAQGRLGALLGSALGLWFRRSWKRAV